MIHKGMSGKYFLYLFENKVSSVVIQAHCFGLQAFFLMCLSFQINILISFPNLPLYRHFSYCPHAGGIPLLKNLSLFTLLSLGMSSSPRHNKLPGENLWDSWGKEQRREGGTRMERSWHRKGWPHIIWVQQIASLCLTPLISLAPCDCGNSEINKEDLSCKITECFEQCLVIEGQ